MTTNINEILIRRTSKIILESGKSNLDKNYVLTVVKNIEEFGYTFNTDVIQILCTFPLTDFERWYKYIIKILFNLTGFNKHQFKPMYPNFPKQVMETNISELYFNAIMHYIGDYIGIRIIKDHDEDPRLPLVDKSKLTVLGAGTLKDVDDIMSKLLCSNTSWSSQDKDDIELYIQHNNLPENLTTYKENVMFLCKLFYDNNQYDKLQFHIKTATDLLRFITALSDGDISLATTVKFKKFNRKTRKLILQILNNLSNPIEDMKRYRKRWQRIGEIIHPGEYQKMFPNTYRVFKVIREEKIKTFATHVETALQNYDINASVELLNLRPGEFARKLDHLIRISNNDQRKFVVNSFAKVAEKVSTNVLLQVMTHFKYRNEEKEYRIIIPKGLVSKIYALKNELPKLDLLVCQVIYSICGTALIERFYGLKFMGKTYIDPILKNYNIPFAMRSSSRGLKQLVRGSKIEFAKTSIIRMFTYWHDTHSERVDLDLSAIALDEDMKYASHLSYTQLKGEMGCHSGDITSAPHGASEFIDINIDQALKQGWRYIIMNVYSYTLQKFRDIPEATAGWMLRDSVQSGEIYEPKTVEQKYSLNSDTCINLPVIFDLKTRQIIWADLGLTKILHTHNNLETNMSQIELIAKSIIDIKKPNLYDLLELHVKARGTLVDKDDADTIYDESFAEQYETIVGEYLCEK